MSSQLAEQIALAVVERLLRGPQLVGPPEGIARLLARETVEPLLDGDVDAIEQQLRAAGAKMIEQDRWKIGQLLGAIVEEHGGELDVDLDVAARLSGQRLEYEVSEDLNTCTIRLVPHHTPPLGDPE